MIGIGLRHRGEMRGLGVPPAASMPPLTGGGIGSQEEGHVLWQVRGRPMAAALISDQYAMFARLALEADALVGTPAPLD